MTRAFYIDRLRVFLTILVIFHHSAIAFGASGGWYYVSNETTHGITQMILTLFMAIDQAYFMSFFFFISAILMPDSYERKGFGKFLKDRLVRLGIPLLVYILLLHPTLVFAIHRYLGKPTGTWYEFVWGIITRHAHPGPMWFVLTLLIFEMLYAFNRHFTKQGYVLKKAGKLPTARGIIGFMIVTGAAAFCIRLVYPTGKSFFGLQFGFFPLYIGMYLLGITANRNNWLERLTVKNARPWFIVSLLAIPILIVAVMVSQSPGAMNSFSGGINYRALTYAIWEPLVCVGFCYFFLLYFKKHFNSPNKLILALSGDTYTAYIIHPLVVVGCTFLSEQIVMPPLARLGFVLITAIPTCFFIAWLIRKVPGIKKVL